MLDGLEAAVGLRLLVEQGDGFTFAHELVREALAADVTAARRAFVHREAARALQQRGDGRPMHTAFHARLGGAADAAAAALVKGAEMATARFDLDVAAHLLDQAVALADGPGPRQARARVRLARSDHAGAAEDITHALGDDAGGEAFELAGWIAYYRRDFTLALQHADEAARRASDVEVRASALALAGRIRHGRGQLAEAADRLEKAVTTAAGGGSGVAAVWLASLRVHQGQPEDALMMLRSIGDDETMAHPFALPHALFARCFAHGLAGRLAEAAKALAALDRAVDRLGPQGRRFAAVALNMRSWLLRSTGRPEQAAETSAAAVELSSETAFEEPRAHATLDLAEGRMRAADPAGAAPSSMAWRPRSTLTARWPGTCVSGCCGSVGDSPSAPENQIGPPLRRRCSSLTPPSVGRAAISSSASISLLWPAREQRLTGRSTPSSTVSTASPASTRGG